MKKAHKNVSGANAITLVGVALLGLGMLGAAGNFSAKPQDELTAEQRRRAADRLIQADAINAQIYIHQHVHEGARVFQVEINGEVLESAEFSDIEVAAQRAYPGQIVEFINRDSQMIEFRMPRTMLGVTLEPIEGVTASQLQIVEGNAIVIAEVYHGMPAAAAELQQYDIILSANGVPEITKPAFTEILNEAVPGEHVNLVILRGGLEYEMQVKLEKYDPVLARRLGAARQAAAANVELATTTTIQDIMGNWNTKANGAEIEMGEIDADHDRVIVKLEGGMLPGVMPSVKRGMALGTFELINENERLHREVKEMRKQLVRIEELLEFVLQKGFGLSESEIGSAGGNGSDAADESGG